MATHRTKGRKRQDPHETAGSATGVATTFDHAYYKRFYFDQKTRVVSPRDIARLAGFVKAYMQYLGQPVRTILDLGCGVGHWQKAARTLWPKATYTGVEVSPFLCQRYGWTEGSVADFTSRSKFDLVICQGVLQYLDDRAAARAIDNLNTLCRGALYLEVLTEGDWNNNVDKQRTDGAVFLRPATWYRRRLSRHFRALGGGLHLVLAAQAVLFELEQP